MTMDFLEDFGTAPAPRPPAHVDGPPPPPPMVESPAPDLSAVHEAMADLALPYHEARAAMIEPMRRLLVDISERLLPGLSAETFGALLWSVLEAEIERRAAPPLLVEVSPRDHARALAAMPAELAVDLEVRSNAALAEGEAGLRFDEGEVAVLSAATIAAARERIAEALTGIYAPHSEASSHG